MIQYFKPSFWRVAMKDPLTWLALAVDLTPIIFVFMFGWGATALVLLYWAENILIGIATLGRIILSGFAKMGIAGAVLSLFLAAFFPFHYGLFCFGHGVFVFSFVDGDTGPVDMPGYESLKNMFVSAATYMPGMTFSLGLIAIYQFVAVVKDYWPSSDYEAPNPMEEMFSPYGRIVVLHIAIFAGAFAMAALGDPMIGMLALILLRAAYTVLGRTWRDKRGKEEDQILSNSSMS